MPYLEYSTRKKQAYIVGLSGRTIAASGSIVMSIFKKKGTVESLFRIGAGDDEAGAKGAAAGAADDANKHEVYYVRGRPFIAPTKTGARSAPRGRGTPWRLRQQSGRIAETRGSRRAQLRI